MDNNKGKGAKTPLPNQEHYETPAFAKTKISSYVMLLGYIFYSINVTVSSIGLRIGFGGVSS